MIQNEWQHKIKQLEEGFQKQNTKSYRVIVETFRQLVMVKDFEKLSVAEISEAAGIARKTFYQYFKDKNEIVEQIVYAQIILPMRQIRNLSGAFQDPTQTIMSWLYEQLYRDRDFYMRISSFTGQNSFDELMLAFTSDIVFEKFNTLNISEQEKEYSIYFYAASHIMVLKKWMSEGMLITPENMALFYEKWTIPSIVNYANNEGNK